MSNQLSIFSGHATSAGIKPQNQDYCAHLIPTNHELTIKGAVFAMADGISTSTVSDVASKTAVTAFLEDYYSTPETWSTKHSAHKVLQAINAWLFAQTQQSSYRNDANRGYVCTFAALIIKSTTAHLFHSGDTRIYRISGSTQKPQCEQLTQDHRIVLSSQESYLSRALGIQNHLELDYQSLKANKGDYFIVCTDGIFEFIEKQELIELISTYKVSNAAHKNPADNTPKHSNTHAHYYDALCEQIVKKCLKNGCDDNLSIQIVHINELPNEALDELQDDLAHLPFLKNIQPDTMVDEFYLLRQLYVGSRSHVYLATHEVAHQKENGQPQKVAIKFPAVEMQHSEHNQAYLESMLTEEWIAKRIDNPHVVKAAVTNGPRTYFYTVSEYFDAHTLLQWLKDNPNPSLASVRSIVTQIAKGLQAMHRKQIIHQDLRLENVLINEHGMVKLIDLGAAKVAGLSEINAHNTDMLGTLAFSAPEYLTSNQSDARSDIFSLGVITYNLLSGQLPFGNHLAQNYKQGRLGKVRYRSLLSKHIRGDVPFWVDAAIEKAVNLDPNKRYMEVAEFIYDLTHPNSAFSPLHKRPLLVQNPVLFWQIVSTILASLLVWALFLK